MRNITLHLISGLLMSFFFIVNTGIKAQNYEIAAIGYYNLENLFDTIDSENVRDSEYLPGSKKGWDSERYYEKLDNMARVLADIATDKTPDGLVVFGVSEIENRMVLEDLVKRDALKERHYEIVHYNSPDRRGIDVALIYNPKFFTLTNSYSAPFVDADTNFKTRDQLVVTGLLMGEEIHFQVNHWPSRSGGERRSRPKRDAAGKLARSLTDSLLAINSQAKVLIVGDLNDDPTNESVAKYLKSTDDKSKLDEGYFFNPYMTLHSKGIGTLAYRDSWNNFDQIILTPALVTKDRSSWSFYKAEIFKKPYMINQNGKYKGYPKRTHAGGRYQGGYSDHFPVYVYLIREAK